MSTSLSFKIQAPNRPSPLSRPPTNNNNSNSSNNNNNKSKSTNFNGNDSSSSDSDEDKGNLTNKRNKRQKDELVTGFDSSGKLQAKKDPNSKKSSSSEGPLIIASLPNKDWRKAAGTSSRKNKKERYIPDAVGSMRITGGSDNSSATGVRGDEKTQGGMGTRDVINDSVVVGGLELGGKKEIIVAMEVEEEILKTEEAEIISTTTTTLVEKVVVLDTEEQRAIRELMAGEALPVDLKDDLLLFSAADSRGPVLDEGDAFRKDVETRPDESTLEDYARVPVGTFGLALLRGMGWKEGTAASRTGRSGPVEAFVPTSRPALLGIGAKPLAEVLGEEKGKGGQVIRKDKREDMKYVPLLKQERGGSTSAGGGSGRSTPAIGSSTPRDLSPPPPAHSSRASSSSRPHSRMPSRSPPHSNSNSSSRHRDRDSRDSRDSRDRRDDDRRRDRDSRDSRDNRDDRDRNDRKRARSTSRDRGGESRDKERRNESSERDSRDDRKDRDRDSDRRYKDDRDSKDNRDRDDRRRRDDDRDKDRRR